MSQEVTYYSDSAVQITNARAVLGAKTYAMANITSVSMGVIPASYRTGLVVGLMGLSITGCACCVGSLGLGSMSETGSSGSGSIALGVTIGLLGAVGIVAGIVLALTAKPSYVVRIGSASGETDALASRDRDYIQEIVRAMNEAIIKRG